MSEYILSREMLKMKSCNMYVSIVSDIAATVEIASGVWSADFHQKTLLLNLQILVCSLWFCFLLHVLFWEKT